TRAGPDRPRDQRLRLRARRAIPSATSSVTPPTTAAPAGVRRNSTARSLAWSASRFGLTRSASSSSVPASCVRVASISCWIWSGSRGRVTRCTLGHRRSSRVEQSPPQEVPDLDHARQHEEEPAALGPEVFLQRLALGPEVFVRRLALDALLRRQEVREPALVADEREALVEQAGRVDPAGVAH